MKQYLKCLIVAALVALAVTAPQKAVPPVQTIASKPAGEISAAKTVVPDKPKPKPAPTQPQSTTTPKQSTSVPEATAGSCAAEIKKYSWNQTVAYNVMMAESHGIATRVNDNPSTGDYSVGCFQINLFGANALSRPSEAWLKIPANNVSYAYGMWKGQGWVPWGATTCKYKVACY